MFRCYMSCLDLLMLLVAFVLPLNSSTLRSWHLRHDRLSGCDNTHPGLAVAIYAFTLKEDQPPYKSGQQCVIVGHPCYVPHVSKMVKNGSCNASSAFTAVSPAHCCPAFCSMRQLLSEQEQQSVPLNGAPANRCRGTPPSSARRRI